MGSIVTLGWNRLSGLASVSFLLLIGSVVQGAEMSVDSVRALSIRLNQALPGDTIVVKNGVYTTTAGITVRRAGEPGQPITIAAETVGGVEINGTHGFNVVQPAAHIVISGFHFTHAAGKNTVAAGTRHVRFSRNIFECSDEGAYLSVSGDDVEVDYNEFRNKKTIGSMVAVSGTGSQVARRVWIHHNYFHNFANAWSTRRSGWVSARSACPRALRWWSTTFSSVAWEKTS